MALPDLAEVYNPEDDFLAVVAPAGAARVGER